MSEVNQPDVVTVRITTHPLPHKIENLEQHHFYHCSVIGPGFAYHVNYFFLGIEELMRVVQEDVVSWGYDCVHVQQNLHGTYLDDLDQLLEVHRDSAVRPVVISNQNCETQLWVALPRTPEALALRAAFHANPHLFSQE